MTSHQLALITRIDSGRSKAAAARSRPALATTPGHLPTQAPPRPLTAEHSNQLLGMLPASVLEHLPGACTPVPLAKGTVLSEAGSLPSDVYFPTTSVVSLVHRLRDGTAPEFALVGNKGMIGVHTFLGGGTMPHSAIVQSPGFAFRIRRNDFERELERSGGRRNGILQDVVMRYSQVLLTQVAQISICNGHHSLRERLCRWLLLASDRTVADTLHVTHENIAALLGVRREGITAAAGQLQSAGLITNVRGRIDLIDRAGLEQEVCECYRVVRDECERLLVTPAEATASAQPEVQCTAARQRAKGLPIWPALARASSAKHGPHALTAVP